MLQRGWKATEETGRIAGENAGFNDIFGNNGAGSDHYLITNGDREDSGICSDTYTIAKFGWPPELWLSGRATRDEGIINKHCTMRNEAIVANRDQLADEGV